MAYQGRYNNGNGNGKSSGGAWKIVLIVVLCVVLVLALLFGAAYFYLESKLNMINQAEFVEKDTSGQDLSALIGNLDETDPTIRVTEETTEATTAPTEPDYGESGKIVSFLIIGQDSREGEEAKLADAIMMMTLNKETKTLVMTSFLRDSYVKLPENYRGHTCGWNRINTSYALGYSWYGTAGAMEMLNLTLENNYGVKVDGNIEIDFYAFIDLVDAIGGVDIYLEGEEYTKMLEYQDLYNEHYEWLELNKHVDLHEGMNTLNGDMALAYARERHVNYGDSDMNRTNRQRKVIASLLDKVTKMSPLEVNNLVNMVLGRVITDISTDEMKVYIKELVPYLFDDLKLVSQQIPADGTYWGEMVELPDGLSGVLKIDFEQNKKILQSVLNGDVPEEAITPEEAAQLDGTAASEGA
ncbi:MAG: LCP family protein [Faecousia sp.]